MALTGLSGIVREFSADQQQLRRFTYFFRLRYYYYCWFFEFFFNFFSVCWHPFISLIYFLTSWFHSICLPRRLLPASAAAAPPVALLIRPGVLLLFIYFEGSTCGLKLSAMQVTFFLNFHCVSLLSFVGWALLLLLLALLKWVHWLAFFLCFFFYIFLNNSLTP